MESQQQGQTLQATVFKREFHLNVLTTLSNHNLNIASLLKINKRYNSTPRTFLVVVVLTPRRP